MSCESELWRPAHWSAFKRRKFEDRVHRHAEWQLAQFLGPYEGAKLAAQVRAQRRASESLARLRNAGVRTLGEVGK